MSERLQPDLLKSTFERASESEIDREREREEGGDGERIKKKCFPCVGLCERVREKVI